MQQTAIPQVRNYVNAYKSYNCLQLIAKPTRITPSSSTLNDIPIHILKLCKSALSPFLAQIFNLCIWKGTYPKSLKCAQIVPIRKGGKKTFATTTGQYHFSHP